MNGIPWFSTFTLFTELAVTALILYVFYSAYYRNRFPFSVAAIALGYETLFNISYMTYRAFTHVEASNHTDSPFHIAVAIFHGTFSLLMFILLVIFMILAWKKYREGVNYFQLHKKLTIAFLIAWFVAIASGFLFYYEAYFSPEELTLRNKTAAAVE